MRESDRRYFGKRAEEERACAEGAAHPAAARVHLEMAERYGSLATAVRRNGRGVILQVVTRESADQLS